MTPEEIAALKERLEANPKSRSFLQLAEAYLERGDTDKALPLLTRGVEFYPYYLAARITLGQVQKEHGESDEAIKNFEFVTRTIPDNLIAQKNLALLYFRKGNNDKTKEAFSVALSLSPNDPELLDLKKKIDGSPEEEPVTEMVEEAEPEPVLPPPPPPSAVEMPEPEPLELEPLSLEEPESRKPVMDLVQEEPASEPNEPAEAYEDENDLMNLIPQTETMGDLFMAQKRYAQAEKIYGALLEKDPQEERIVNKLERAKSHTPLDETVPSAPPSKPPEPPKTVPVPEPVIEKEEEPVAVAPPPPVGRTVFQPEERPARTTVVPRQIESPDDLIGRLKDRLFRDLLGIIMASENGLLLSDQPGGDENSEILAAEGVELLRQLDELALSLGQGTPVDGFIWLERSILYFVNQSPTGGGLFLWLRPNANIGRCRLIIQQELGISPRSASHT
jgi:tetratricopeptide (TPR) repeat protein